MRVLVVIGTRPEVIKLAPVIFALRSCAEVIICSTGQHREMLQQAINAFNLNPDVMLDVMSPGRSLNILSARLLERIDQVLESELPDLVVVQGDTTSAMCAALAAFQRKIQIAHVEAGLRTRDISSPFPEEANRCLIARIADIHFAPTKTAAEALLREGVEPSKIHITGNTVVDAIEYVRSGWINGMPNCLPIELHQFATQPFVLVTCHRRENFGDVIKNICSMIKRLCASYPDLQWIFPVHLNPEVRTPVRRILRGVSNLFLTEPLDYSSNLWLISKAKLIVSDSGGIQEEAPTFGTPVVVMRKHTERQEGIVEGFATLAGQDAAQIEDAIESWLGNPVKSDLLRVRKSPYGDGKASSRIVSILQNHILGNLH